MEKKCRKDPWLSAFVPCLFHRQSKVLLELKEVEKILDLLQLPLICIHSIIWSLSQDSTGPLSSGIEGVGELGVGETELPITWWFLLNRARSGLIKLQPSLCSYGPWFPNTALKCLHKIGQLTDNVPDHFAWIMGQIKAKGWAIK